MQLPRFVTATKTCPSDQMKFEKGLVLFFSHICIHLLY